MHIRLEDYKIYEWYHPISSLTKDTEENQTLIPFNHIVAVYMDPNHWARCLEGFSKRSEEEQYQIIIIL